MRIRFIIVLLMSTTVKAGGDLVLVTGFEPRFNISGTASGVAALGETVQVTLNDQETIDINTDGVFAFTQPVEANQTYLLSQNHTQCTLVNESGLMPYADVTDPILNCPPSFTTVYDIKQGFVTGDVALQNMLVTACGSSGYYVQTVDGDPDFIGTDYSGVYVFNNTVDCMALQPGDRVDLNPATVVDFLGEIQLQDATYAIQSSGNALPTPVLSTPAALNTPAAHPLNGVLVEVQNVVVTSTNLNGGEYVVDMDLTVDDRLHLTTPFPEIDEPFTYLRGPMAYNFNLNKIQPRDVTDLGRAARLVINEVDYDQPGPDTAEFVEIYNAGPGIADLTNVSLELVNGLNSTSYQSIDLTSLGSLAAGQYLVVGSASVVSGLPPGTASLTQLDNFIQNGTPDGVALIHTTNETLLDALSYEGAITVANVGLSNPVNLVEGTLLTAEDSNASAGSLSRIPNGVDTDDADNDWIFSPSPTPGNANLSDDPAIVLLINEVDYDQPGTDTMEFIEIFNPSAVTVDLSQVAVVLVNGSNSTEYNRIALSGMLSPGGYAVVANVGVSVAPGALSFVVPDSSIQNGGPDGLALIDVVNNSLIDALSYEGSITAAVIIGFASPVSLVEGNPTTAEDIGTLSIIRSPNGSDTGDDATDFVPSANPTPGDANQL